MVLPGVGSTFRWEGRPGNRRRTNGFRQALNANGVIVSGSHLAGWRKGNDMTCRMRPSNEKGSGFTGPAGQRVDMRRIIGLGLLVSLAVWPTTASSQSATAS